MSATPQPGKGWTRRRFLELAVAAPFVAMRAGGAEPPAGPSPSPPPASLSAAFPRVNLKSDCGAVGDGRTNDTAALRKAAELIQQARGGELVIPPGIYVVGEQRIKSDAKDSGPYYRAADMFKVHGVARLRISGYGATLRIAAGLRYGGFEPRTGQRHDATGGQSNAAAVGRILEISESADVVIEGLELDGNNEALALGGQWGNIDRQVSATGLWLNMCRDVRVVDVHTHHHGLDGITVLHLGGPPPGKMPHRLERVVSAYNGRQGLSWIGGWGLECIDCKFNHTGRARNRGEPLMSKPRAGLDIEPNARTTQRSRDGIFTRCEFINNAGAGVVAAEGDGGYSTFVDCTFWGTTNYSLYVTKPGMEFSRCRIHGTATHASDGRTNADPNPNPTLATRFEECSFEDKAWTDGTVFRNHSLYTLDRGGEGVTWRRCTFTSHEVLGVHIAEPSTTETFESCTFVHGNTALADGAFQSMFQGSRLKSCHFKETAEISRGPRAYFISLGNVKIAAPDAGDRPTLVDGPRVRWGDAASGKTGVIGPGIYG